MDENDRQNRLKTYPKTVCPSIGFLTESLNSFYQSKMWTGASEEAIKRGYTLLCFAGGSLKNSPWDQFEPQRNTIYNLIDTKNLQGLIISGSLGNFITEEEFSTFYERFKNLPVVCLGPDIKSIPTVVVDNIKGVRDLLTHLVEFHSCQKIAFVRGPKGNKEAEHRLQIFRQALTYHEIAIDEDLIIPGDFSREAGIRAVEHLYKKKYAFDALVCANDDMALGALKMFHELHIKVPEEVLIAGFDDIEECAFSSPPLTSVHQPLFEMGARAVEAIIDLIDKKPVGKTILVPATISIRQSCGCFKRIGNPTELFNNIKNGVTKEAKEHLINELMLLLGSFNQNGTKVVDELLATKLVELFCTELTVQDSSSGQLLKIVSRMAWTLALIGGDVSSLIQSVAVLRQFAAAVCGPRLPAHVEDFIQSANLSIVDAVTHAQAHRRFDLDKHSLLLRDAGQAIASAFDLEYLLDVIASEVIKMEIFGCWVSFYENPTRSLNNLRLVLQVQDGKSINVNPTQSIFSVPEICPPNSIRKDYPRSLLLEPLFFRGDQIGIIVFDVNNSIVGYTYEILRLHISSALKGALLVKTVQAQAQALEIVNSQLQKLRDSEHAYLEAIKHELDIGREIQVSFLPRNLPVIDGWEICPAFQPARAVSGDFYDVFTMPDGNVVFIISDVSGKDVGAALFMALIRTLIRALAERALSGAAHPLDAIKMTNHYLINHHYGNNGRYMYATCFMGQLDPIRNVITYVNAGHNPPAIVSANGTIREWVDPTGPAVGIIPDGDFTIGEIAFQPGELLFCYTDGITEARSPDGAFFSKQRLADILSQKIISAENIVQQVDDAVKQHGAGKPPFDDITILALRRAY